MKITRFKTHAVRVNHRGDWMFLEVQTSEGINGFGEINPEGMGLLSVLSITGSISLSYHILIAMDPPLANEPPIRTISEVITESIGFHPSFL